MSKLRILYVFSIAVLAVLSGLAIFRPLVSGQEFSTVARESVLEEEDQWIIQFDIINREPDDVNYVMVWDSGSDNYTESVMVPQGKTYSHIRHIYKDAIRGNEVQMTLFKENEQTPLEDVTYHLK